MINGDFVQKKLGIRCVGQEDMPSFLNMVGIINDIRVLSGESFFNHLDTMIPLLGGLLPGY